MRSWSLQSRITFYKFDLSAIIIFMIDRRLISHKNDVRNNKKRLYISGHDLFQYSISIKFVRTDKEARRGTIEIAKEDLLRAWDKSL